MSLNRRQVLTAGAAALAGGLLIEPLRASAKPVWADGAAGGSVWSTTPVSPVLSTPAGAPGKRFPGDPGKNRLYYGATVEANLSMSALEKAASAPLTLHRTYFSAGGVAGLVRAVVDDQANHRMPMTSTKCPGTWAAVAAGQFDSWLNDLLTRLNATKKPVLLALHHEPEDNAGPSGMKPSDWVAMQNHAIARAKALAPNVTIVPILMCWTLDSRSGRKGSEWEVPNAKIFGVDVYNDWATTNHLPWTNFSTRLAKCLTYANGRPIVVAEHGVHTDPSQRGRAAAWMADAFTYSLAQNVVGLSYYDSDLHSKFGSWVLDAERGAEFQALLRNKAVVPLP